MSAPKGSPATMWDGRYGESMDEYAYGIEPNDFLKESLATIQNGDDTVTKSCLMLADGEGRNGVFLAKQGYDVVSMDCSKVGLEKADRLAKAENITSLTTVLGDLADFDLGKEKWDCIVGIYCHLPPPIRSRVLRLIPEALKSGGYFVLEAYTPDQIPNKTGGPPVPELMYSKAILEDSFSGSSLEILLNEEKTRNVVEGKFHTGKAAVVQFIGRKP